MEDWPSTPQHWQGPPSVRSINLTIAARWALRHLVRPYLSPILGELAKCGQVTYSNPQDIFKALARGFFPDLVTERAIAAWEACDGLRAPNRLHTSLISRGGSIAYPPELGMEDVHAVLLAWLVRTTRPEIVVETGVANGVSTRFILESLEANGTGTLHSIDVDKRVGGFVPEHLKNRWNLIVLPAFKKRSGLRRAMREIGPIDIFLHDSDHSYGWQSFEYRLAYTMLRQGGLLLSDDVDSSYAFLDFARSTGRQVVTVVGHRKLFGIAMRVD